MPGFPPGGAFNVFVPGLLVMTALFGSTFVGFGFIGEMRGGVVERMRVTPMSRTAAASRTDAPRRGRASWSRRLVLVVVAIPFGLRIDPVGVVVAFALLALIGLVLGPVSYAMALVIGSEDALAPITQAIALPLILLSGMMLPMSLAPDWLRTIAELQPLLPRGARHPGAVQRAVRQPRCRVGDCRARPVGGRLGRDRLADVQPRYGVAGSWKARVSAGTPKRTGRLCDATPGATPAPCAFRVPRVPRAAQGASAGGTIVHGAAWCRNRSAPVRDSQAGWPCA